MEVKLGLQTGVWVCPCVWDCVSGPHTGVWVRPGVWIPTWGYIQAFGIPKRGYTQVLGFPPGATHRCSYLQPGLHTGVWSHKRAIVQVANAAPTRSQIFGSGFRLDSIRIKTEAGGIRFPLTFCLLGTSIQELRNPLPRLTKGSCIGKALIQVMSWLA